MRLEGGRLVGTDGAVDIVYRRLVSEEAFARAEEIGPLLTAYLEDAACFVGGFRTDPAWSKTLFVVLSDPAYSGLFGPALREELDACVPWTRELAPASVTWKGQSGELSDLLVDHQKHFLIKPARAYEGRGALSGACAAREAWRDAVRENLASGGWVAQELLHPGPSDLDGARAFMQVGEFVLLGALAGFLARSSPTAVIGPRVHERYHPVGTEVPWEPRPE